MYYVAFALYEYAAVGYGYDFILQSMVNVSRKTPQSYDLRRRLRLKQMLCFLLPRVLLDTVYCPRFACLMICARAPRIDRSADEKQIKKVEASRIRVCLCSWSEVWSVLSVRTSAILAYICAVLQQPRLYRRFVSSAWRRKKHSCVFTGHVKLI